MSIRKNLNDILNPDRSIARAAQFGGGFGSWSGGAGADLHEDLTAFKSSTSHKDLYPVSSKMKGHSCYTNHPPLVLGDYTIYGGSCLSPMVNDANVYIGFQSGMHVPPAGFPWNGGTSVPFDIPDMGPPKDAKEFLGLVKWTLGRLALGDKVHCGCIGGHGRTGTFLAALCREITGEEDAITYVRTHYCKKAVESSSQVDFLNKHFGIKKVSGAKEGLSGGWGGSSSKYADYPKVNHGERVLGPLDVSRSIFKGANYLPNEQIKVR